MAILSIDQCTTCTNGELVFALRDDTGGVIVECLECLTGYGNPSDLDAATFRTESAAFGLREATIDEVRAAGFGGLVRA